MGNEERILQGRKGTHHLLEFLAQMTSSNQEFCEFFLVILIEFHIGFKKLFIKKRYPLNPLGSWNSLEGGIRN